MSTGIIGFLQGTLTLADLPRTLESSARVSGVIVPIIAMSLPLAQTLAALDIPQSFVASITALTSDPTMIILLMIAVLIAAGCVMETTPNIVILSPLLLPLAQEIGMSEVHFAVVMISALGVGFITPPLGLNLFVIAGITGESILNIAARAVPFVLGMLAIVLLLAFVPQLSMWAFQ
jgi:TRAP-type C4-dicarboxylate transport system permease large subunit